MCALLFRQHYNNVSLLFGYARLARLAYRTLQIRYSIRHLGRLEITEQVLKRGYRLIPGTIHILSFAPDPPLHPILRSGRQKQTHNAFY
jgi:hypothetical protein